MRMRMRMRMKKKMKIKMKMKRKMRLRMRMRMRMKVRAYQVLLEVTRSLSQCGPLDIYELGCEYMDDIGISLRMMFTVIKKNKNNFSILFHFLTLQYSSNRHGFSTVCGCQTVQCNSCRLAPG